jgi:hypothetical protein
VTVAAEVLAQRVTHRPERLVDVGIVRLSPMMKSTFACLKPVLVADASDLLHLFIRRIAPEIGRDDRVIAQDLRH